MLWVNETFGRRITRFAVTKHGLGRREVMHEFGPGEFPDGFAFDARWSTALFTSLIVGVFILSLVVLTGYAGQLSLAQYAIGGLCAQDRWARAATWAPPG